MPRLVALVQAVFSEEDENHVSLLPRDCNITSFMVHERGRGVRCGLDRLTGPFGQNRRPIAGARILEVPLP